MSRVDVLAVLDKLPEAVDALKRDGERRHHRDGALHLELGPSHYAAMSLQDELAEARDAVADLITAAKDLENGAVGADSTERLLLARLRDALARIGGDK